MTDPFDEYIGEYPSNTETLEDASSSLSATDMSEFGLGLAYPSEEFSFVETAPSDPITSLDSDPYSSSSSSSPARSPAMYDMDAPSPGILSASMEQILFDPQQYHTYDTYDISTSPIPSSLHTLPTPATQVEAPGPIKKERVKPFPSSIPLTHVTPIKTEKLSPSKPQTRSSKKAAAVASNKAKVKAKSSSTAIVPYVQLTLSKDEVLRFNSKDLDDHVRRFLAQRASAGGVPRLTAAEQVEVKKQTRLVKNRESANLSRQRRKDKVGDLEVIVQDLEGVNNTLTQKVDTLASESAILRAELNQLLGVIRDSPALSQLLVNISSIAILCSLMQTRKQTQGPPEPVLVPVKTEQISTVAVC
eukprot:TRINITY_DN1041_c0_g1_i2.p1 TRINITY_DN1041_c0_g1~~TRINITY_DN1041_c0_g1_i2.p1  ORF type:complete len:360 (-),score=123.01 TRINITY_DN1041_c0_g1_i2:55-1134(-)